MCYTSTVVFVQSWGAEPQELFLVCAPSRISAIPLRLVPIPLTTLWLRYLFYLLHLNKSEKHTSCDYPPLKSNFSLLQLAVAVTGPTSYLSCSSLSCLQLLIVRFLFQAFCISESISMSSSLSHGSPSDGCHLPRCSEQSSSFVTANLFSQNSSLGMCNCLCRLGSPCRIIAILNSVYL